MEWCRSWLCYWRLSVWGLFRAEMWTTSQTWVWTNFQTRGAYLLHHYMMHTDSTWCSEKACRTGFPNTSKKVAVFADQVHGFKGGTRNRAALQPSRRAFWENDECTEKVFPSTPFESLKYRLEETVKNSSHKKKTADCGVSQTFIHVQITTSMKALENFQKFRNYT